MGRDFYAQFSSARRIFDAADEQLGFSIKRLCFEGPAADLQATVHAQVGIYVTTAAIYEAVKESGKVHLPPDALAGLSLGEYTALYLAGAFSFAEGLRLVHARGQLMQQAAQMNPGTMVALLGAPDHVAEGICRQVAAAGVGESSYDRVVVPANFNAPGQIVLSGSVHACRAACQLAMARGLRTAPLDVAGAFHSPLMASAVEGMQKVLDAVPLARPQTMTLSNVTAGPHGDPSELRALLVQQLISPVRWRQSLEYLQSQGVDTWLELGPGRVLTGLLKKLNRRANVTNISTVEGWQAHE